MLPLREFTQGYTGFPSLLNYFGYVDGATLLNKDGSYLTCLRYRGEDMESASGEQYDALSRRINQILMRLGTHWMLNIDAVRVPAVGYPDTHHFTTATAKLIEARRKGHYQQEGAHFETYCVLTLTYTPPKIAHHRSIRHWFIKDTTHTKAQQDNVQEGLAAFNKVVDELTADLSSCLSVRRMGAQEIFQFLQACITGRQVQSLLPDPPHYLNYCLGAYDFVGGIHPAIDGVDIGVVSVIGFPSSTCSGMLRMLDTLPFSYRFSTRFISMDARDAEKQLTSLRTKLQMRQLSVMQTIGQALSLSEPAQYSNQEAYGKTRDADQALNEAREGHVRYGYYSAVIVVMGTRSEVAQHSTRIRHMLETIGLSSRVETMNAVEAYLGSLPGHAYPNVRKPMIHTLNLAHLLPLATIWAGLSEHPSPLFPSHSPPLFYAATSGTTPFRFHLHVSDVGHSLVLGPTGAGKSTLLGLIVAQFMRYKGAQIVAFDKGLSQYALCKAMKGTHYHLLSPESPLTFCPLGSASSAAQRLWAAGWVEELLRLQGLEISPRDRNLIHEALASLEGSQGTFTDFYTNLQENRLKEALEPFVEVTHGIMAGLFDAAHDTLESSDYMVFEVDEVMKKDMRYSVPILTYLFQVIERRLDGRPTLIVLDEAWNLLAHPLFREKIREWLKVLRKANASVIFATQSLSDIIQSPLKDVIIESCPTKIFLPNAESMTESCQPFYASMGLSRQQIGMIADAMPKRHYYYTSPHGSRMIELALCPATLAFVGVSSPSDIRAVKACEARYGGSWPAYWLKERVGQEAYDQWVTYHEEEDV